VTADKAKRLPPPFFTLANANSHTPADLNRAPSHPVPSLLFLNLSPLSDTPLQETQLSALVPVAPNLCQPHARIILHLFPEPRTLAQRSTSPLLRRVILRFLSSPTISRHVVLQAPSFSTFDVPSSPTGRGPSSPRLARPNVFRPAKRR
jgi:hypothetical protein